MLYDFYKKQNSKKEASVHATYLITGTQIINPAEQVNGAKSEIDVDIHMQSSPYMSSSLPNQDDEGEIEFERVTVITLAKEEHLEG